MIRHLLLLTLLAVPAASAGTENIRCGAIQPLGGAGSGLSQLACTYAGPSIPAAYRAFLAYERSTRGTDHGGRLPEVLPARNVSRTLDDGSQYRVRWQGRQKADVVLIYEGDLPGEHRYTFRRRGQTVQIIRLYEAP